MGFIFEVDHEEIERITSEKLRKLDCRGFLDEDFYDEEFLEVLHEDDEINGFESGFMRGYLKE